MSAEGFLRSVVRPMTPVALRPMSYLPRLTFRMTGGRVFSGPFKGMAYIEESFESCYIPKVLGIYERELQPAVEAGIASSPRLVVDIGTAEGYYAVGVARRVAGAKVVGFEAESAGRVLLGQMLELNGMREKVKIRARCEVADLNEVLGDGKGTWVICDCEGYEEKLLDPAAVPGLANAMVLAELHDMFIPGVTAKIVERFSGTHVVEQIAESKREISEYPFAGFYTRVCPKRYLNWAVNEGRTGVTTWLWMRPKAGV